MLAAKSNAEAKVGPRQHGRKMFLLNRAQIGKLARYFHVAPGAFAFTE